MENYEFTQTWFEEHIHIWNDWLPKVKPAKILEIGSFEGRSACYLIEKCSEWHDVDIHCVDTWEGGVEHQSEEYSMSEVERRFRHNIEIAMQKAQSKVTLTLHKGFSYKALAQMIAEGRLEYFDFIYIDGSHQAPDVLSDAVMAFPLLRVGGVIIFDDYVWYMEQPGQQDLINMPKIAVDAFVNIFQRKVRIIRYPIYQLYLQKTSS